MFLKCRKHEGKWYWVSSEGQAGNTELSGTKLGGFYPFDLAYSVAKSKKNPVGVGMGRV